MTLNIQKSRLITSAVIKSENKEYLNCKTTIGLFRNVNEDFAVSIVSQENDKMKLLVVCDGVAGSTDGGKAAELVALEFIKWFNSYDFNQGLNNFEINLNYILKQVRSAMYKKCIRASTTLTFAIVGEQETVIGNVGDSRAYIIRDGNLTQITDDDSMVWEKYYSGKYSKDDLRFLKENNIITNAIGRLPLIKKAHMYYVLNSDYDGILLTSDGVSDILSDDMMSRIFQETKPQDFLDELLWESCFGEPDYPPINEEILIPTLPGKDNATAAMYLKLKS